jgi:endonuclease YncB( thermonuclease family)
MRRAILLVLVGSAAFAAVYLTPGERPPKPAEAEETAAAVPTPDSSAVAFTLRADLGPSESSESAAPAVRNVTPANMTVSPPANEPPVRVTAAEVVVEPSPARMQRLYNPIVVSAGVIKVREREIGLAAIEAPAFDARCEEGSAAWPCGRMARAALRRFIRGRAIECEIPAGAEEIPDAARCEVAGTDISAWLIEQGWARRAVGAGDTYAEAETAAREAKLGLWGKGRPDAQPEELAANGG